MGTTVEGIQSIFEEADIKFEVEENLIRTTWVRDGVALTLVVFLFEDGGMVQLRVPTLLYAQGETVKPLLFRAMLQMAHEIRLVQFEYDPSDGEVSTCIDIVLEDGELSTMQLLRCCSVLLDVSYLARERFEKIVSTGQDPAWEPGQGKMEGGGDA